MPRVRLPIAGGCSADQSVIVSPAVTVNAYVEPAQQGAKAPIYLQGTPGSVLFATAGLGPIRGLWEMGGVLYAVSGTEAYAISAAGAATKLGDLQVAAGPVGMADNGTQLIIVDGDHGYIYNADTEIFAQITDPDFPGATHVAYVDGYFVFCGSDEGRWGISALQDGTSYDALDFVTAESDPDDTIALAVDHREVWAFGANSAEPWQNTGAADFPFERIGGGTMDMGIAARYSLVRMNNTLYWLAGNKNGFRGVARANEYRAEIVSSDAVTDEINNYAVKSDAIGFTYSRGQRLFYVLVFPAEGVTWVYDTGNPDPALAWHRWEWDGLTRHRASCAAYFNDRQYVGDFENGNIYRLDPSAFTDNGDVIRRKRIQRFSSDDGRLTFCDEFQAFFEPGVGDVTESEPQAMLRVSRDGGYTYGNQLWRPIGKAGDYRRRSRWLRLGRAYDWALELTFSDPAPFRLIDAYAIVRAGTR